MTFAADVNDLIAATGQVLDQVVGPNHVRTCGVHGVEPHLRGPLLDLRRDAVRGEDHRAALDLFQAGESVRGVDQPDALVLELVGDVCVVDELAEHVHRTIGGLTHTLGDAESVDYAVAVTARRDSHHFHRYETTTHLHALARAAGRLKPARYRNGCARPQVLSGGWQRPVTDVDHPAIRDTVHSSTPHL